MNSKILSFTQITKQKKIDEQIDSIIKWINDVNGHNPDEAKSFIKKHLFNLNESTKKSMYENLLDITDTKLIEINKKNDLMMQINELTRLLR